MLPERVHLSEDALFQELDGEAVILDMKSSSYFGVDGVGVQLWQLLQENPDLGNAITLLARKYDVAETQLREDIDTFIKDLARAGLVTLK